MFDYDKVVGSIYDCAANPDLWEPTIAVIRDHMHAAYFMVGFADTTPILHNLPPIFSYRHTPWDKERLMQLSGLTQSVPGVEHLYGSGIDKAWTQMSHVSREEFNESHFNKVWAQPQGLTDSLNTIFINRQQVMGLFSCAMHESRGLAFDAEQCRLAEMLSPHFRRAVMINDIVDKGNLALALYRKTLDALSAAVFIVGPGRRLVFTNAAGEAVLSGENLLKSSSGQLQATRVSVHASAFDDALDRAVKGDVAAGLTGIGVPLIGIDGERAAAYVLPIAGQDLRGALGLGHCAVFVARRGEQQPMAMEILRTVFDLTASEARIALMLTKGDGPQEIAEALNVTVDTIRSHLKHAYVKVGATSQTELCTIVNSVLPPIATG